MAVARSDEKEDPLDRPLDLVSENTDFEQILYGDADYWMSPDISAMDDYKNSSSKRSYASVIVWPLRVFGEEDTRDDKNIFGFLCLDSKTPNAFSGNRELQLGWWYVDILSIVLQQQRIILDSFINDKNNAIMEEYGEGKVGNV